MSTWKIVGVVCLCSFTMLVLVGGTLGLGIYWQLKQWEGIKYQSRTPDPDQVVVISARQFEWRIRYPDPQEMELWTSNWNSNIAGSNKTGQELAEEWSGNPQATDFHTVNQLHVWKAGIKEDGWGGANVKVHLQSRDVIHSFFAPCWRIKQDALPGKTIPVWFQANEANTYNRGGCWCDGLRYDELNQEWVEDKEMVWEFACAELCGRDHVKMRGRIYVHENKADFVAWLKAAQTKQSNRHADQPDR